jgi:hypothetical protein
MNNNFLEVVLAWTMGVYFSVASIMMFYFWYIYAQHESFAKTLFIGPLVGIFKGVFWIFYI